MDKKDKDYKYAKTLAIRWRNSKKKIIEKLLRKGLTFEKTNKIIDSLQKDKLLNEKESFEAEIFALEQKRYGYQRIKETLITKGYERNLISTYIFNKDIEKENCDYYFKKGYKKYKNYKYFEGEREKLFSYLKRYGFNDKMVAEVLKEGATYEDAT